MMFLSLLFRSGRPMLTGALLTACGIALVAVWALTAARCIWWLPRRDPHIARMLESASSTAQASEVMRLA